MRSEFYFLELLYKTVQIIAISKNISVSYCNNRIMLLCCTSIKRCVIKITDFDKQYGNTNFKCDMEWY